jgi:hypothetical protein
MVEFQVGGRHWKRWNAWNKRLLIDSQIVVGEHAGSWDPGDVWCPRNPMPGPMPDAKGRVVDALLKVEQEPGERKNCAALAKALGSIDDLEYLKQLLAAPGRSPQIAKDMISLRIGMILSGLEKHDEVVPIYAGIYERSGRPANVRRRYVTALIRAGMHRKALDILLPADRTADIDFPSTNTILLLAFSEKSDLKGPLDHVYSRLNPENSSHTRLKYVLAREARRRGRTDWTARLLGDVYRGTGRPESLVKAYVNALLSAKQNREASGELEYAIRAGYRAPWAFESLADTYHALEKGDAEVLRAITSEIDLYPCTRMPRTQLAKYWSKLGKTRKEIDLVREITKEILEERLDDVRHYRADDAP